MSSKELRKSFATSYFSTECILASQVRVPCQAKVTIKNCGILDPTQDSKDIPVGSRIELPIWAAAAISKPTVNFVEVVDYPKFFRENYRQVLKADACVLNLRRMGPQFYQSGLQLCALPIDQADQLSEALPEVLQKRLIAMSDAYHVHRDVKCTGEESKQLFELHCMDPLEMKLFNDSKNASEELDNWFKKQS